MHRSSHLTAYMHRSKACKSEMQHTEVLKLFAFDEENEIFIKSLRQMSPFSSFCFSHKLSSLSEKKSVGRSFSKETGFLCINIWVLSTLACASCTEGRFPRSKGRLVDSNKIRLHDFYQIVCGIEESPLLI